MGLARLAALLAATAGVGPVRCSSQTCVIRAKTAAHTHPALQGAPAFAMAAAACCSQLPAIVGPVTPASTTTAHAHTLRKGTGDVKLATYW